MAPDPQDDVLHLNRDLQARLEEAEATLEALRSGEIDAIVVSGTDGDRVYTLKGADEAYRVMMEGMAEGALTLTLDGLILFSNEQFARIVQVPLERVMGSRLQDFIAPEDAAALTIVLSGTGSRKTELRLRSEGGTHIPVYLSSEKLVLDGTERLCLIITDLTQQKRSEEIVAAEKLARSILEQAAEAILVVDPDGCIIRASRAADRLAGAPVLGRAFDELFRITLDNGLEHPFREIFVAALEQGAMNDIEVTALTRDGRSIELLLGAGILPGIDSVLGGVITLTDITERKLRERQLKFQADIIETTAEAVIAIDPNRRVTLWNSGAERLYEVAKEDALGKPLSELYRPVWSSLEEQRAHAALEKQGLWSGEQIHVRRNGTQAFVNSTANFIGPEHGGGMFAVVRDIAGSKKAEAILRESEARERSRAAELEGLMEAVPAAVFIAQDAECRSMVGNHTAYKLLRLPSGANISRSAPEHERPQGWREQREGRELAPEELPMETAARTGQPVHNYEFDLAFHDGTYLSWLGNAVPLLDPSGNPRGAIGAFVDITERKRSEERLRQTQKLESIGLLAGGIAHDFNNLLVGVIGNASLAQDMLPFGHRAIELLQGVVRTGEQLAHLTRQMLAYSGKGRFVLERLDLSDLIPEMSQLVQPSIPKKIGLNFELQRNLPPIEADRGQMQQVFMNLVLNASEAIGAKSGLIAVKTSVHTVDEQYVRRHPESTDLSPGEYVSLEVRDTGSGMDPETQARIFDPFFSTKFTGRGLGLAAVSGIVRGHRGAIRVTSAPGKGSCFTVLFPAVQSTAALSKPEEPVVSRKGTGTILVVDDEKIVREMARRTLTRYGFEVLLANNGIEALDILKRYPGAISLVVLDLSMPEMSGEEALPEFRKIRPGIKVLVSSGYNEMETMALFKGYPVSGFIQKPYTVSQFADKINTALENRNS